MGSEAMTCVLQQTVPVGSGISESAVRFAVGGRTLVGNVVVSGAERDEVVVFVHGWSGNRSGPHGLITAMARALGEAGFASLRFDFGGRGDSEGSGLEASLSSMASDLVGAVAFARERTGCDRVILFGICSGGNVAIGALPQISGTVGLVLLSVYPFSDGDAFSRDVHRTWHFALEYWRKAQQPDTWRRLFKGDVRLGQVLNVLFGHFLRKRKKKDSDLGAASTDGKLGATSAPAKAESRLAGEEAPKKHLANFTADTPALMVYGGTDPDAKPARTYFESYAKEHSLPIDFVHIEGANHNFSSVAWKRQLAELAGEFCRGRGG